MSCLWAAGRCLKGGNGNQLVVDTWLRVGFYSTCDYEFPAETLEVDFTWRGVHGSLHSGRDRYYIAGFLALELCTQRLHVKSLFSYEKYN